MNPASKPLGGLRILVTRPARQGRAFANALRHLGAEPILFPTIRIAANALRLRRPFETAHWLVFTSANGVRAFASNLSAAERGQIRKRRIRIAAIGPGTAKALRRRRLRVDFVPSRFRTRSLGQELPVRRNENVVLLRASRATERLEPALRRRGAKVRTYRIYRAVPGRPTRRELAALRGTTPPKWIIFTSPSTARNLQGLLDPVTYGRLRNKSRVASIGPITSKAARRLGFRVAVEAADHTVQGIIGALARTEAHDAD